MCVRMFVTVVLALHPDDGRCSTNYNYSLPHQRSNDLNFRFSLPRVLGKRSSREIFSTFFSSSPLFLPSVLDSTFAIKIPPYFSCAFRFNGNFWANIFYLSERERIFIKVRISLWGRRKIYWKKIDHHSMTLSEKSFLSLPRPDAANRIA